MSELNKNRIEKENCFFTLVIIGCIHELSEIKGMCVQQTKPDGTIQRYEYDNLNRLKTRIDSINNDNKFTAAYNYRTSGEIDNVVLNNSVTLGYTYNSFGYIDQVHTNNQLVWDANSMNKYGVIDNFTLGNQANTSISCDTYGFVDGITTVKSGSYLQNWDYNFNPVTGNLTGRTGLNSSGNSVQENFTYDDLNRLLTYSVGANTNTIIYDENGLGNITDKTDVGGYDYTVGVHNVSSITDPTTLMQNLPKQAIEYNKFNKVSYIRDSIFSLHTRELFLTYGPDRQRVSTVYKTDNVVKKTKYFALGLYEKEIDSTGNARELYYISGPDGVIAILQKMNNQDSIFYIHKDYLGSYDVISKYDGTVKERNNFDPWGRRRNPVDWSYDNVSTTHFLDRGFTGHEHLDQFGLINMNGRVYDPLLAMFLSPDNNLQSPDFTQNFNRYTYCLNNPLKYTDPSGEFIFTLLASIIPGAQFLLPVAIGADIGWISGGIRGAQTPGMNFWDGAWRGGITGAVGGALSMVGGAGMSFAANLGLGTAGGALTGGLDAALWGNDVGKGMLWGAAGGALMTTVSSENMSNLFKGEGFYTNENVFNNMMGRGMGKKEMLDYFGFEGTYNPTAKSPSYVEGKGYYGYTGVDGEINYGDFAFNSYDNFKITNIKESYHSAKALSGQPFATQDVIPGMNKSIQIYPEERLGFISAYKNQGLALHSTFNLNSQIGYYQIQCFNLDQANWYLPKWWHFMYKIPRRW